MKAKTSADPASCIPTVGDPRPFEQCQKPFSYFGERQASHVVMILDASGSMAGKVNGKTKMSIAKQESAEFLRELATDVPVGLVAYGHQGTNKESGKQVSCGGIETLLPIEKKRREIADAIETLKPTGWTPLAGALKFAEAELGNQSPVKEGATSAPVVYLISDGEETCGGDPVAAARSLHESGVQATVHVIGFDVDEATRAQLEAISEAGGGRFFPAEDAKALRDHLNSALKAEASHAHYNTCILRNEVIAITPFRQATLGMPACINRQTDRNFSTVMHKQIRALTGEDKKACSLKLMTRTHEERSAIYKPLLAAHEALKQQEENAREAARKHSIESALEPKQ